MVTACRVFIPVQNPTPNANSYRQNALQGLWYSGDASSNTYNLLIKNPMLKQLVKIDKSVNFTKFVVLPHSKPVLHYSN